MSFVGVSELNRGEEITCNLHGYGGGNIALKRTTFSFSFLKYPTTKYSINSKIEFSVPKANTDFDLSISWNVEDKRTTYLSLKQPGVYLVTVNLLIATRATTIELKLRVNGKTLFRTAQRLVKNPTKLTVPLTGAFVLRRENAVVTVNLKANDQTIIQPLSAASVTFITRNYLEHPVLLLRMRKDVYYGSWRYQPWRHVHNYNLEAMSGILFENMNTVVPINSGVFMVSCQMIVSVTKPRCV